MQILKCWIVDSSCQENGPMKFAGLHSKYLFDGSNEKEMTRDEAKDLCEKWDYQIAEVENIADLTLLKLFVQS